MSYFDLSINIIESVSTIVFIYRIFGKRDNLISYFFISIINFLSITFCNYMELPEVILIIFSIIILFLYSNYINRGNHSQNIFIALFLNMLLNIANTLAISLVILCLDIQIYTPEGQFILSILSKTIYFIIVLFSSKHIKKHHFLESKILKYIVLAILLLNCIYSVVTDYIFYGDNFNFTLNILLLLIDALTICLCFVFFEAQKEQEHILRLQRKTLRIENLETIQSINEDNYQRLRKWKHDINHVFNAINYQLNNKEYDSAIKIIDEYNNNLNNSSFVEQSGNAVLDYLLLQKINLIKHHNIHLITNCTSDSGPFEDTHFFIIVGNLIDNAIENCSSDFNKQLWIKIGTKPEYYFISIKNSIKQSVLTNNPNLETTKDDANHHGIGIRNVKLLVNHYNGLIRFEEEDDYFIVKILIPNNPAR